eukprot:3508632-Prymnesium_polylepis.1
MLCNNGTTTTKERLGATFVGTDQDKEQATYAVPRAGDLIYHHTRGLLKFIAVGQSGDKLRVYFVDGTIHDVDAKMCMLATKMGEYGFRQAERVVEIEKELITRGFVPCSVRDPDNEASVSSPPAKRPRSGEEPPPLKRATRFSSRLQKEADHGARPAAPLPTMDKETGD